MRSQKNKLEQREYKSLNIEIVKNGIRKWHVVNIQMGRSVVQTAPKRNKQLYIRAIQQRNGVGGGAWGGADKGGWRIEQ